MNQQSWVFIDEIGRQNHVGLLHGPESGHLLIHCNSNIVIIEFEVNDSKSYSIFIEEQLCRIELEKNGTNYSYKFIVDKKADIPINRRRKKIERKHLLQTLGVFLSFVLITVFAIIYMHKVEAKNEKRMRESSRVYLAEASIFDLGLNNTISDASFNIWNSEIPVKEVISSSDLEYLEALPLENGDKIPLRILEGENIYISLNPSNISGKLLLNLKSRTTNDLLSAFPNIERSRVLCILDKCMKDNPMVNLAKLRSIVLSSSKNPKHEDWDPEIYKLWSSDCTLE